MQCEEGLTDTIIRDMRQEPGALPPPPTAEELAEEEERQAIRRKREEQRRECEPIVRAELERLMKVSPKLHLQALSQHDEYAPSGIFDDLEQAVTEALKWNAKGYNINYLLNEPRCAEPENTIRHGDAISNCDIRPDFDTNKYI